MRYANITVSHKLPLIQPVAVRNAIQLNLNDRQVSWLSTVLFGYRDWRPKSKLRSPRKPVVQMCRKAVLQSEVAWRDSKGSKIFIHINWCSWTPWPSEEGTHWGLIHMDGCPLSPRSIQDGKPLQKLLHPCGANRAAMPLPNNLYVDMGSDTNLVTKHGQIIEKTHQLNLCHIHMI